MMDIFQTCHLINDEINNHNEPGARDHLIRLLDFHKRNNIPYSPLVNSLIRQTGLYPYLQPLNSSWQERFIYESFKVKTGDITEKTLHREQSVLLKKLVNGESVAVSAPTSFGKSFVIDSFIAIKQPKTVLIIVPTIALTDETRRRLYKKFSNKYKIITTTDVNYEESEKCIFVFPQERAISYIDKIPELDILVIDEFYKASNKYDKDRSPSLLKAIIKLSRISKQRYFLAPNITGITDNVFTKDMEFINMLDFSTVFLEKHDLYKGIGRDELVKSSVLVEVLGSVEGKSLIYAASHPQINKVSSIILDNFKEVNRPLLNSFANWLTLNYDANWQLTRLIKRATGIHNGQIHRSLSQIQIKLFEEENGLSNLISTSSIIEGVNTSAENVIIWRNRKGGTNAIFDDFTYKNIIGRGGRMFKHFIGKIYLLEAPPESSLNQLNIEFPDSILGDIDEVVYEDSLNKDQVDKIISFKYQMTDILGRDSFNRLLKEGALHLTNSEFIKQVALDMKERPSDWNGFGYLNSSNPNNWAPILYRILRLQPGNWDTEYNKFVSFIQVLSQNWNRSIPELLEELDAFDLGIDDFFKLEKNVSFKLSALINDVNVLQKEIINNGNDVSSFISKLSHAFLPSVVYQLEEYGLPRMISRKLHLSGIINFEDDDITTHMALKSFKNIGKETLIATEIFSDFEKYLLEYFYDGITADSEIDS